MISSSLGGGSMPIHLSTFGEGPPLVLLHGFSDDGGCWSSIARPLVSDGWRVVCPDARGHGRTPLPDNEPFTGEQRLVDAVRVLESIGTPAPVVGHSMGALTALCLAAARPELVTSVVLEDPPLLDRPPAESDVANPYAAELRKAQAMTTAALLEVCRRENPGWSDEEQVAWVSSKQAFDVRIFERKQTWLDGPWQELVQQVECPALLITGQPEQGALVESAAVGWLRANSSIGVVEVADAGHVIHRDQPAQFLEVVRGFLAPLSDVPGT